MTKGGIETTLGIHAQFESYVIAVSRNKYNLNQHYGFCNAAIEDQDLKKAAESIVKMLNEKNKVKDIDKELETA